MTKKKSKTPTKEPQIIKVSHNTIRDIIANALYPEMTKGGKVEIRNKIIEDTLQDSIKHTSKNIADIINIYGGVKNKYSEDSKEFDFDIGG